MHAVYIGYSPGHTGTHDWHWHMVGMGPNKYFPQNLSLFQLLAPVLRILRILLQLVFLFNYVCRILEHQKEEKVGADNRKVCDIIVTNMWHYFLPKWSWIWNGFLSSLSLYVTLRGNLQDGTFHYPALLRCICILMKIANIWFHIFVHFLRTWKKVKMLLQKVLWDFRNSPPTLCVLLCLIICTVLCCLVFQRVSGLRKYTVTKCTVVLFPRKCLVG